MKRFSLGLNPTDHKNKTARLSGPRLAMPFWRLRPSPPRAHVPRRYARHTKSPRPNLDWWEAHLRLTLGPVLQHGERLRQPQAIHWHNLRHPQTDAATAKA